MKILIASIPAAGHLNPLLSIATLMVQYGHEVAVQVSEDLRPAVESAGHRFLSEIPNAQTSAGYYFETYPERMQKSPGMEMTGYDLVHFFARNIAAQSASLKMALYDFPADLILADSIYWGTLPMLVGPRDKRPAIAHLGISVVNLGSGKNIPMRTDETPEQREAELQLRKRFMLQPAQQAVNAALASLGYPALPCPILEAMTELPDLYLHPGIESFEYPDSNSKVRYIGALPTPVGQPTLPEWWQHLDPTNCQPRLRPGHRPRARCARWQGRRDHHRYHRRAASRVHSCCHPLQRPHRLIPALRADHAGDRPPHH